MHERCDIYSLILLTRTFGVIMKKVPKRFYVRIREEEESLSDRRIVIAGTESGSGKTTVTIGLMSALRKKGYTVQGFKCGPDYIDPSYHTSVTGRCSRNLDSWMLSHDTIKDIFKHGSTGADISIIEGVMGLFDGKSPENNNGSTAEISFLTNSPVILVVDCYGMARSAAAIVKGFQCFSNDIHIAGVIANCVGSDGHFQLVKTAVEQECSIPVVGYLKREQNIELPERHLGLVPSIEYGELDSFFEKIGNLTSETVDIDHIYEIATSVPKISTKGSSIFEKRAPKEIRIAVAKDAAFNFYYQENLELLEAYGAECVYFSPLKGEPLPDNIHGIYLGGGFPEKFAIELANNHEVKVSIKHAIENGVPTLAECGGYMYLANSIETTDGERYEMVGIVPGSIKMQSHLSAIGYREITGISGNYLLRENEKARGHEFHYSTFHSINEISPAYKVKGVQTVSCEGYMIRNLVAGYTHLHFASCLTMVKNFVQKCRSC
jgi:cobyrinic acid a,c-diamide synthase